MGIDDMSYLQVMSTPSQPSPHIGTGSEGSRDPPLFNNLMDAELADA